MKVEITSKGDRSVLLVDGVDMSLAASGATVRYEAGCLPVVTLDLCVIDVSAEGDPADFVLPKHTCDLLIALGWTTPDGRSYDEGYSEGWADGHGAGYDEGSESAREAAS